MAWRGYSCHTSSRNAFREMTRRRRRRRNRKTNVADYSIGLMKSVNEYHSLFTPYLARHPRRNTHSLTHLKLVCLIASAFIERNRNVCIINTFSWKRRLCARTCAQSRSMWRKNPIAFPIKIMGCVHAHAHASQFNNYTKCFMQNKTQQNKNPMIPVIYTYYFQHY